MGMMQRLAGWAGYEKRSDADPTDPSWSAIAAGIGWTGALSTRAAENLSAVFACSTVIASSLASIPALVYRRDGDNRIEALTHPLRRITRIGANELMGWPDFLEHLIISTLLTGNGLAEILRTDRGQLAGFRFIPWGMVSVAYLASGRLGYDVADGRGGARRLLQSEVLHLRDRTDDGFIGRSRLNRAAETVEGVATANIFARAFLDRGASPGGSIEVPGTMTELQRNSIRDQMRERHSGAANAGSTLVLDGGMKWNKISLSPEDAELLETRKFGVEEICRLFQVPPPLVQDYSNNTFTNSETAGRWFAMFTLGPWARKIEAEFARSVFPGDGRFELSWTCRASFAAIRKPAGQITRSRSTPAFSTRTKCARSKAGTLGRRNRGQPAMTPEIVTLQEAKLFCRIDGDAEDSIVGLLIGAATDAVVDVADGWTPGDAVPDRIKLAVLMHVARAYDERQDGADMPVSAGRLIAPYRKVQI